MILVDQIDFLQVANGLLKPHLDRGGRVPAVVYHHVHEQFRLVQLLLQAFEVNVGILSHLAQLVQFTRQIVNIVIL